LIIPLTANTVKQPVSDCYQLASNPTQTRFLGSYSTALRGNADALGSPKLDQVQENGFVAVYALR
jgi:hypothetical protein